MSALMLLIVKSKIKNKKLNNLYNHLDLSSLSSK